MRTIELSGVIDENHSLRADVPADIPSGAIRMWAWLPDDPERPTSTGDEIEPTLWMKGVAAEWNDELADIREDIYTMDDGRPADEAR